MKNCAGIILGLFLALASSWIVLVLGTQKQLSSLSSCYDPLEEQYFPMPRPGQAIAGEEVYTSLGCAACHTQQVRRPSLASDVKRGWGKRQSVARDYLLVATPQLGRVRRGPDLANLGVRAMRLGLDRTQLMLRLYQGSDGMPPSRFLFETIELTSRAQLSALPLEAGPGKQIVPTPQAEVLVAYLLDLKQSYAYPEAMPATGTKEAGQP